MRKQKSTSSKQMKKETKDEWVIIEWEKITWVMNIQVTNEQVWNEETIKNKWQITNE